MKIHEKTVRDVLHTMALEGQALTKEDAEKMLQEAKIKDSFKYQLQVKLTCLLLGHDWEADYDGEEMHENIESYWCLRCYKYKEAK